MRETHACKQRTRVCAQHIHKVHIKSNNIISHKIWLYNIGLIFRKMVLKSDEGNNRIEEELFISFIIKKKTCHKLDLKIPGEPKM